MSGEKGYTNQALELNESGKSPYDNTEDTATYKNVVSIGMTISLFTVHIYITNVAL